MRILSALACDYGRKGCDPHQQDGLTLGPHSCLRLEGMWEGAVQSLVVGESMCFVFSAGRLSPRHERLCDLQAQWVKDRWAKQGWNGEPFIVIPNTDAYWGSKAEIEFLGQVAGQFVYEWETLPVVEVMTEDYHRPRVEFLVYRLGLSMVVLEVSSADYPPTAEELWHERRAYFAEQWLPRKVVRWLQQMSRTVRARRYGLAR